MEVDRKSERYKRLEHYQPTWSKWYWSLILLLGDHYPITVEYTFFWGVLWWLVVRILCFHHCSLGSIPVWELRSCIKLLHVMAKKKKKEYSFFSNEHRKITKINHVLNNKTSINKYKRIKIIQNLVYGHNEIKFEINNRKISGNL